MRDEVFRAVADPTRRRILRLLQGGGEKTAGELAEQFDISAPSMSHHFNVLKQAELVNTRREGQQIFYSLNATVMQEMLVLMMDLFAKNEKPIGETS